MLFSPSVRVAGCNEVNILTDLPALHSLVTHDFLDKFNGLCSVGLIKEENCVNFFLTVLLSKLLSLLHLLYHILYICPSVDLHEMVIIRSV